MENFSGESIPENLHFNKDSHNLGSIDFAINNPNKDEILFGFPVSFPLQLVNSYKNTEENWIFTFKYKINRVAGIPKSILNLVELKETISREVLLKLDFETPMLNIEEYIYEKSVKAVINIELLKKINGKFSSLSKKTEKGYELPSKEEDRKIVLSAIDFNLKSINEKSLVSNVRSNVLKNLYNISEKKIFFTDEQWGFDEMLFRYRKDNDLPLSPDEQNELIKVEQQAIKNLSEGNSAIKNEPEDLKQLSLYHDPFGFFLFSNAEANHEYNEIEGKNEIDWTYKIPSLTHNFCLFNNKELSPRIFEFLFYEVTWLLMLNPILSDINLDYNFYTQKKYKDDLDSIIPGPIKQVQRTLNKLTTYILKYVCSPIKEIIYIPSARVIQSRIYNNNNSSNTLASLAGRIQEMRLEQDGLEFRFVNLWLKELGLCDNLEVEIIEGTSSRLMVWKNNRKFNLIDQGFGVAQIITVLLEIAILAKASVYNTDLGYYSRKPIMIIEEPEANLHPKLQSKLADMFADAAERFEIQFIIETHSEYFIRKLQYMVANGELKPTDITINYFNDPFAMEPGDKKIREISIQSDGSLTQDFGPGFFDEALNWKFELMKLKNLN